MKSLKFIPLALAFLILAGCRDYFPKPISQFPITIVTLGKIIGDTDGKFPSLYEKLCIPYETDAKSKTNFAPSPIIIKRLDVIDCEFGLNIIADEKKSNINSISY